MRTLAIDLGSRRIGLAMSDEGGQFATPYDVLTVNSPEEALAPIQSLIAQESVQRLVLGLPLNMDDSLGPAAKSVLQWAQKLRQTCPLPIIFVDERLRQLFGRTTPRRPQARRRKNDPQPEKANAGRPRGCGVPSGVSRRKTLRD